MKRNGRIKKIVVLAIIFVAVSFPLLSSAQIPFLLGAQLVGLDFESFFGTFAKKISEFLLTISSFALVLTGMLFDKILEVTIVNMSKNLSGGLGDSITSAWATLRDIANMCFIFILLFAAFKSMFDLKFGNFGVTIRNIIIVALLINFSLFFTKVVIDASNIVSIGFYKASINNEYKLEGSNNPLSVQNFNGISGGYMKMMGLQTLYSSDILNNKNLNDPVQIMIIGILSAVFMLVTAVILLISSVMFIARFIILIFLMILSPLALIAFTIPQMKKHYSTWADSLISQSFFAPLFFALTWVVFKFGSTLRDTLISGSSADFVSIFSDPRAAMGLIINYVILIGLAIATLIFSKQMASKAVGFNIISGGIGTAALGGTAWASRNTLGRGFKALSESSALRDRAAQKGFGGMAARMTLGAAGAGAKGSFDVRSLADTKLGKKANFGKILDSNIIGKAGGTGGFAKSVETKAKAKADYAKNVYGSVPGDKAKDEAAKKAIEEEIKTKKAEDELRIKSERKSAVENAKIEHKNKKTSINEYERNHSVLGGKLNNLEQLKKDRTAKEKELQSARKNGEKEETIEKLKKESESFSKSIEIENQNINDIRKDMEENDSEYIAKKEAAEEAKQALDEAKKAQKAKIAESEYNEEIQKKIKEHKEFVSSGNRRQQAYAKKISSGIFGWRAVNQAAQRKIEEQSKEKSKKDKLAEAAQALIKDEEDQKKSGEEIKKENPKEEKKEKKKSV